MGNNTGKRDMPPERRRWLAMVDGTWLAWLRRRMSTGWDTSEILARDGQRYRADVQTLIVKTESMQGKGIHSRHAAAWLIYATEVLLAGGDPLRVPVPAAKLEFGPSMIDLPRLLPRSDKGGQSSEPRHARNSNYAGNPLVAAFMSRLRNWRIRERKTLQQMSAEIGFSVSILCEWELGNRFPSAEHLQEIANYTGIPACCMLHEGDGPCPAHRIAK